VPFPPGGPLDVVGRLIAKDMSDRWSQPVVIDNKPGGTIGTEFVARAPKDGYTLMIISSSPLVTLPQMQKVGYDVLKDFTGVAQTATLTYALMAHPSSGLTTIQQMIDAAKKSPGRLNYASAGNGSGQHLYVELIKIAAGVDMTHVPYKGAAPAMQALMAGEVPIMLDVVSAAIPLVKSGKARALLVTGDKLHEALPGAVPYDTLFPGTGISSWHGVFAPAGTPRPIVERVATAVRQSLQTPATAGRFRDLGFDITGTSGEEFNDIVRRDHERWGQVIRKNNLRSD
jgi:tripartite-type tricarboxylate transporter receptor subunit TctC